MDIKMIDLDKDEKVTPVTKVSGAPQPFSTEAPPKIIKSSLFITIGLFLVVAVAGFYTGAWLKAKRAGTIVPSSLSGIQSEVPESGVKVGDIFGSADEKSFKDSATGVLEKGGFNGEGTHSLIRTGGKSQTVYLTSTSIDLDTLVGNQITVWGQTFKGIKVGWLMDVGRVKVEALNAPLPK
jgi:hypothetical protein